MLDHVRVTNGTAGEGGGVANVSYGRLAVTHSLIDHNAADSTDASEVGGGIYSDSFWNGALVITDSTIAYNTAASGAGIAVAYAGEASPDITAELDGVTLARNFADYVPARRAAARPSRDRLHPRLDHGREQRRGRRRAAARGGGGPDPLQLRPAVSAPRRRRQRRRHRRLRFRGTPADPQLGDDLVAAGGETPLLTIASTSPAVDLAGACEGSDQRDLARPQGKACDAGAFEVAAPAIDSGPSGQTADSTPTFTFSSADPGATFECRLDGPTAFGWAACSSPKTYAALATGDYTFRRRAAGASAADPAARSPSPRRRRSCSRRRRRASPAQTPVPTADRRRRPTARASWSSRRSAR